MLFGKLADSFYAIFCKTNRYKPCKEHIQATESPVDTYLRLVGYSSGVKRNMVLKDPVMAIFPIRVNTKDAITMDSLSEIETTNITFS